MDKQAVALAIKIARAFVDTGTFVVDKPHTAEAHIRGLATLLEKALAELPDGDSTEPHNLLLQMQQQLGTPIGEVRVETLDGKLYHYTNWPPEVEAARSKSQPAMSSGVKPSVILHVYQSRESGALLFNVIRHTGLGPGTHPLYLHPAPTAQDSNVSGLQGEKLKFLQGRSDFRRQCWEEVAKLDFENGRSCYVDIFGRVLWLDAQDSKVPEGWRKIAHNALEGAELFAGENDYLPDFWAPQLESMLNEIAAAPSLAEKPDDFIKRVIYLVNGHEEAVAEGNHGDAKGWMRQLQNLLTEKA